MTLFLTTLYPFLSLIRLIIGGQDGSVTFLVVAHNTTPEQLDESRTILRRLPSRKRQKRHYDEDNKENKVSKVRSKGCIESSDKQLTLLIYQIEPLPSSIAH